MEGGGTPLFYHIRPVGTRGAFPGPIPREEGTCGGKKSWQAPMCLPAKAEYGTGLPCYVAKPAYWVMYSS